MIAHRGLSGVERENTNAAFIAAGNRSYYGIETDLHVTKDGHFVLIHDETTGRVSDKNINVERSRINKIKKIVLKSKSGKTERSDLRIPLLSEYIAICKTYGKVCVLELKGSLSMKDSESVVRIIRDMNYLKSVIFISFNEKNLLNLRKIIPECAAQLLTAGYDRRIFDFLTENRISLDIHYKALTKEIVDEIHGAGLEVNCWTIDDPAEAERLVSFGVDYITTNILE